MNSFKRIVSLSLSVVIFMTHIIALDHSLEHNSNNKEDYSISSELQKVNDLSQDCSICDIYLDVELSKNPTFTYTLLTPKLIIKDIFNKDNSFSTVIFNLKKSRAPPIFIA
ncbi:MAG: hypothetical protein GKR88_00765 [Flavobacteriaceae bacterium]|nr:MAG: hypothetical protein GKR88_00765 [Flavobacteriaceae bacterium]